MRYGRLINNTAMLYLLTFSNYFFSLITVPYQTRILGPEIYGNIGFASAFMVYFSLVLDFGFLLSATEEVSQNRENKEKLSVIFSSVTVCKAMLSLACAIVFIILCFCVDRFRADTLLFVLYFLSALISGFLPDYLYRGMEQMESITVRSVLIRFFFTLMIFVFLKDKDQYYLVPFFTLTGNVIALIAVFAHVRFKMHIRLRMIGLRENIYTLKRSSLFFYSRIASTIYSVTNTFILGIIYGNSSPIVGYYTASDKLVSTGKQGITPIIDSLYPYMVKEKNFNLIKRILIVFMPIITIGCCFIGLFSYDICAVFFGEEFREAGIYLRYMMPILWCAFPAMLFGFPVLSPLGLAKYANLSNIIGAIVQIFQIAILFAANRVSALNICIVTCITELLTMAFRIGVVTFFVMKSKKES